MKKIINILILGLLITSIASSCKKQDESPSVRLAKFAKELNEGPDKELDNGIILTGCEYTERDTLFTYIIKVSDNRYNKLEVDSIKRNFTKTVKSDGMRKIVKLLNKANVGLKYRLQLPEVAVEFSSAEIADISGFDMK